MKEFKPTLLYIKQHSVTGLKYFGKTTGTEDWLLNRYKGGGLYWNRHLAVHGAEYVPDVWHSLFTDKEECIEFATFFSEEANIVESPLWANVKPETGVDGGQFPGYLGDTIPWNKGKQQTAEHIAKRTGLQSVETKAKRSASMIGKNTYQKTEEHRAKTSATMTGRPLTKIQCPHCGKSGGISQMKRWHLENCKEYNRGL